MKTRELVDVLVQRKVIAADAAPPPELETRPWYIGALLGGAGWLAGLMIVLLIVSLARSSSSVAWLAVGVVLLASAFALYLKRGAGAFLDQLALALSIAGQIAIAAFLADHFHSATLVAAIIALLQCALVVAMPNRSARVIATLFACIAAAIAIRLLAIGDAYRFLAAPPDAPDARISPLLLGWLATWLPVIAGAWALVRYEPQWLGTPGARRLRPVLSGLLLALSFATFASGPMVAPFLMRSGWREASLGAALMPLLGVAAALFALACAFRVRSNALMGCAVASALLYVSEFYYVLGVSLLAKSLLMVAAGALLLGVAAFLRPTPSVAT